MSSDSFWIAAATGSGRIINTRSGESATPVIEPLEDGRVHLRARFDHGAVEATLRFDGDFLVEAEIDSDGHTVRLERMPA